MKARDTVAVRPAMKSGEHLRGQRSPLARSSVQCGAHAAAAAPQVAMSDGVDEKIVEAVAASLQRLNSALDDMVPKVSNGSVMAQRSGLPEDSEAEVGSGRFAKTEDGEQYSRRKLRAAIESRLRDMFDL